jgi:hypothetical protein
VWWQLPCAQPQQGLTSLHVEHRIRMTLGSMDESGKDGSEKMRAIVVASRY